MRSYRLPQLHRYCVRRNTRWAQTVIGKLLRFKISRPSTADRPYQVMPRSITHPCRKLTMHREFSPSESDRRSQAWRRPGSLGDGSTEVIGPDADYWVESFADRIAGRKSWPYR